MSQSSRGRRQGINFTVRVSPAVRIELEDACSRDASGPKKLGPWLVWRALGTARSSSALPARAALPRQVGTARAARGTAGARGTASAPGTAAPADVPLSERLILDLCAGSGSWSEPYKRAGYNVRRVTLPDVDVRTFQVPDERVWGVLAAPPCTEFSLAKNGHERDFVEGMACVNACMRVVLQARPLWWALENPVGLLSRWLGLPRFVFEPYQFGDPWSKRTAIWGDFGEPTSGPFVQALDGGGPICSLCYPDAPRACSLAEHRAITPPGFSAAFFEANP